MRVVTGSQNGLRGLLDELLVTYEAGQFGADGGCVRDDLLVWLNLMARWNRALDITAARDDRELVDLMVADAVMLASRIAAGRTVVDVGSGGGAPGLALALLRPDLHVTLVEPMQKRAALLRTTLGSLQGQWLSRVDVVQARGENVDPGFDVALSRATLPPPQWLALGTRLASDGMVWVLLARDEPPVCEGWEVLSDEVYQWPLSEAQRRAVAYRKAPL